MSVDRFDDEAAGNGQQSRRTMLAPVAYSESAMPALRLARSSRIARNIAKWLLVGLILTAVLLAFAPWQQSVTGSGSVLAYLPDQRPQVIGAPIKGRIVRWGENIYENAKVRQGDFIAEIHDLDDAYAARLEQKLVNSQQGVAAAQQQLKANQSALAAASSAVQSYRDQVKAYESVKRETIAAQDAYIEMATKKVSAERQQLLEYQAALPQLQAEFDRTKILQEEGNIALQRFQEVERKLTEATAKVNRAEAYLESANADLEGKKRERVAKIEKAQVDIDYAQAALQKATSDVAKVDSDVAKAEQELNKAQKIVLDMQVEVARQAEQIVTAPFDGIVVQITPNLKTAILNVNDPLCTIVPETTDRSVQLWLDGNDAPLVEPGRHVRLQFEGWPAVQFSGWPSVAVGTFGGEVVSVDATDNGQGKFRILIRPDLADKAWPADRFLRQGVRTNGWVLLNRVPLWFEVWRQLNGFPPVVDVDGSSDKSTKGKPPKLPK